MARRKTRRSTAPTQPHAGRLTFNRQRRSGHYQARNYSEVYRDGKVYVYTCWNDNDDEVGAPMSFEDWLRSHGR